MNRDIQREVEIALLFYENANDDLIRYTNTLPPFPVFAGPRDLTVIQEKKLEVLRTINYLAERQYYRLYRDLK